MSEEISRQRKWYRENKERAKKSVEAWRKNNPEKVSEFNRQYRLAFIKKHGMPPSRYYALKKAGGSKKK